MESSLEARNKQFAFVSVEKKIKESYFTAQKAFMN